MRQEPEILTIDSDDDDLVCLGDVNEAGMRQETDINDDVEFINEELLSHSQSRPQKRKRSSGEDEEEEEEEEDEDEDEEVENEQWNWEDGFSCSICMEAWTNEGDHHICCLPCGHIFGLSYVNKWLGQSGSFGKCQQCSQECALKDVRKLFAPWIGVKESQKMIETLQKKYSLLKKKKKAQKKEAALKRKVCNKMVPKSSSTSMLKRSPSSEIKKSGGKIYHSLKCKTSLATASQETKRAFNAALELKSTYPSLRLIVHSSAINDYRLHVPAEFCDMHLPRGSKDIEVKDSKERKWVFQSKVHTSGRLYLTGWSKFVRDNDVKPGDVCVFEVINSNKVVLKASVFHA